MTQEKPWEPLKELIDQQSTVELKTFLDEINADDLASAVNHISTEDRTKLLSLLSPEDAANLVDDIPWVQALRTIQNLEVSHAAAIISEMTSDEQADFLDEMDDESAEAIMTEMDEEEADNIRQLIEYGSDTAGGLMITEFLAYEETMTVEQVVKDLSDHAEKYQKFNLQYIYVTKKNRFVGVLNMRSLLLSKPKTLLSKIVLGNALTVNEYNTVDELVTFFNEHDFHGVPVVNQNIELKGVVLRDDLREAQTEKIYVEHLESQGIIGGEEIRTMPILWRVKRRLSWLSVNILLNIVAASVIAFYQDTLSSVIALAVFLPIISDMSGCSGNQAVAISMRELSLGVIKPFEIVRVWLQEISVGLLNGIVLGMLIGAAAWLWKGSIILGLVVGGALAINTVVAVSLGGTIPLFLKKMKVDPALASGPILTTITDMFGFFLALTFANLMLEYL